MNCYNTHILDLFILQHLIVTAFNILLLEFSIAARVNDFNQRQLLRLEPGSVGTRTWVQFLESKKASMWLLVVNLALERWTQAQFQSSEWPSQKVLVWWLRPSIPAFRQEDHCKSETCYNTNASQASFDYKLFLGLSSAQVKDVGVWS